MSDDNGGAASQKRVTGRYTYRGTHLGLANKAEFVTGRVEPTSALILDMEFPENRTVGAYEVKDALGYPEFINSQRTVKVTGGFTDRLGPAVSFSKNRHPPGVVLLLRRSKLPPSLTPVEYRFEWFNRHPGALAHVSTISDGEVRVDGTLSALLSKTGDKYIIKEANNKWVRSEATSSIYTEEREEMSFTDGVNIESALEHVLVVRGTTGSSPYTLLRTLDGYQRYKSRAGGLYDTFQREQVALRDDYETQAKVLYDEVASRMKYDGATLSIVCLDSMNGIMKADTDIPREAFAFVYDGSTFSTDYDSNADILRVQ